MVIQFVKPILVIVEDQGVHNNPAAYQLELILNPRGLWMATYIDESLAKLEWFEGSIPWMYLDTHGNVTVGVGLLLEDDAAAQKLPFVHGSRAATPSEIAAEFQRVHAMPMGRPAMFYRREGELELEKADIDSLLRDVLTGFEGQLRNRLPGYDAFPDGVKIALLDMAYNLGPAGLIKGYPALIAAVECGNWAKAAANCFRHGPGAARNQWTERMFRQCVVGMMDAASEGKLARFGYGIVGLLASGWEHWRG
jgi:GH24 family phage-related lysozyme (muramidase)